MDLSKTSLIEVTWSFAWPQLPPSQWIIGEPTCFRPERRTNNEVNRLIAFFPDRWFTSGIQYWSNLFCIEILQKFKKKSKIFRTAPLTPQPAIHRGGHPIPPRAVHRSEAAIAGFTPYERPWRGWDVTPVSSTDAHASSADFARVSFGAWPILFQAMLNLHWIKSWIGFQNCLEKVRSQESMQSKRFWIYPPPLAVWIHCLLPAIQWKACVLIKGRWSECSLTSTFIFSKLG